LAEGQDLEDVFEILRTGPRLPEGADAARAGEDHVRHGAVLTGLTFEAAGTSFGYAVVVPEGYDPAKPCALLLDPGHGSGADADPAGKAAFLDFYRERAREAGLDNWLLVRSEIIEQVGADGKREPLPEAQVVPIFDALLRDVASRWAIDPNRIFVAGLSQTAFWGWYLGAARADRFAGLVPMASVTWQLDPWVENVRHLVIHALHGAQDPICKVEPARRTYRRVAALAPGFRYVEIEGAGHDGRVFSRVTEGLQRMAQARRDPLPRSVSKSLGTLDSPWCYWLRVDELERAGGPEAGAACTGGLDAAIDRQTVEVVSEGVRRATVLLSPRALDLNRTVSVVWNGKRVFRGKVELDLGQALDVARARCDWGALFPVAIELGR
jgi:hypothetical protein